MFKQLASITLALALAACGSKSSGSTTPDPNQPLPGGSGSGSAVATPDPKPTEPTNPTEPTKSPEPSKPDPAKVKAELLAAETAAWDTAKPVFEKNCASCHTKTGKKSSKKKLDHMDFTTYPIGGHHTGTIGFAVRDVLGISGKKPTMPFDKPGSVKGDELAAIKAWTDAWEAADKGGAHPKVDGDHHDD